MYGYYNYYDDYDAINESALDMAMDMSDRYGVAVEDAYEFACGVLEGSGTDNDRQYTRKVTDRDTISSLNVMRARQAGLNTRKVTDPREIAKLNAYKAKQDARNGTRKVTDRDTIASLNALRDRRR